MSLTVAQVSIEVKGKTPSQDAMAKRCIHVDEEDLSRSDFHIMAFKQVVDLVAKVCTPNVCLMEESKMYPEFTVYLYTYNITQC